MLIKERIIWVKEGGMSGCRQPCWQRYLQSITAGRIYQQGADLVSAVEESIQAEAKGLTASPSDAEKTKNTEKEKNTEKTKDTEKTKKTNTEKEKFLRSQGRNAL